MRLPRPVRAVALAGVFGGLWWYLVAAGAVTAQEPSPSKWATQTAAPDTTPTLAPDRPVLRGFETEVVLLTPESGSGIRPLLEWEAVDDADHYGVYLYAPSGEVYWLWVGPITSVHVGGEPRLRDEAPGPSIVEGMSWAVVAYDASRLPIAVSPRRTIGP